MTICELGPGLSTQSRAIQQHLLWEEQVTLQTFYNIAASAETAENDQRTLSDGPNKHINTVTRCGRNGCKKPGQRHCSKSTRRSHRSSDVCMRCGHYGCHNDKYQRSALSSICDKCGKLGHFVRICQSSSSKPAKVSTVLYSTGAIHQLKLILDGSSKIVRPIMTCQSQNILADFPALISSMLTTDQHLILFI